MAVDRCPECGYDPAEYGLVTSLLGLAAVLGAGLAGLLVPLVWVAAAVTGVTVDSAISATVVLVVVLVPSAAAIYSLLQRETQTPTGDTRPLTEVFEDE